MMSCQSGLLSEHGWPRTGQGRKATADTADIVDLISSSGARIVEVLVLRWSDIDLGVESPTLTIKGPSRPSRARKTYRKPIEHVRTVVLPQFAVAVLRRRADARGTQLDAVFPTRNGT